MFNRYFQQELSYLKELGEEFSRAHPAVAPMLSGTSADPDVERLLEGVAFLTGLLRQKLDDEFPEIVHELIQLIWPHYLRPLPCATIVAFKPKPALKQPVKVSAGVEVASIPVDGTTCFFRTTSDVHVHPLTLTSAFFIEPAGKAPAIRLVLELRDLNLSEWKPGSLRLFLSGSFSHATDLYLLLRTYLRQITLKPLNGGTTCILSPEHLKPAGFSDNENLIPYPSNSFPGYRIIQEYFFLPEKFLFLDLTGWEAWTGRGEERQFEIHFELNEFPFPSPRVKTEDFVLFATPVINIFPHEADPIRLDHRKTEYAVSPAGADRFHYQVYSLEKVVGFAQGTAVERPYVPFDYFAARSKSDSVYHIARRNSPVRTGFDVLLSIAHGKGSKLSVSETLSIEMLCTNGTLPENLQVGDISVPTSSSPELVEFSNIRHTTVNILPPLEGNILWRLLSHLSLNFTSIANAKNLQAILGLYVFEGSQDKASVLSHKKRIAGIEKVESISVDRLISGVIRKGREIRINLRSDHFSGPGDLYLFGCMLDYFLGLYASINTFTRIVIKDVIKGDTYQWPERLGDHPLI
ncbi:MAG: type VI secretion system baseplate subunit TssF [Proteobacteria bacterium]|nr:type VI secretion system baseplate subunit TssF [Pseudomonadota bacterium]